MALELLLEVAATGRENTGLGRVWRAHNSTIAEAFAFVLKEAEKVREAGRRWDCIVEEGGGGEGVVVLVVLVVVSGIFFRFYVVYDGG